jgi:hypothetical protein
MTKTIQDNSEVYEEILSYLKEHADPDVFIAVRKMYEDHKEEVISALGGEFAEDSGPRSAVREMQAIEAAKAECAPVINAALAFDSAASVYRQALKAMGVDTSGTPPSSMRGIFRAMRSAQRRATPGMAMDSAAGQSAAARVMKRFPGAVIPRLAQ